MNPPTATAQNELAVTIREKTEELAAAQRILNSARAELGRSPSSQGALDRVRAAQGPVNTINDELAALAEIRDAAIAFDLSVEGQAIRAQRAKHRDEGKETVRTLEPLAVRFDGLMADLLDTLGQMDGVLNAANHNRTNYVAALPLDEYAMFNAQSMSPLAGGGALSYALAIALHKLTQATKLQTDHYMRWNIQYDYRKLDQITMKNAARAVSDHVHATYADMEKRYAG